MKRIHFVYAVFCFFVVLSLPQVEKLHSQILGKNEQDWILHQWVVAEAYDTGSGRNLTSLHASEVWQFLEGEAFVLFNNQILEKEGEWEVKEEIIFLNLEEGKEKKIFKIIKRGKNELLLLSDELKLRLLKLGDV